MSILLFNKLFYWVTLISYSCNNLSSFIATCGLQRCLLTVARNVSLSFLLINIFFINFPSNSNRRSFCSSNKMQKTAVSLSIEHHPNISSGWNNLNIRLHQTDKSALAAHFWDKGHNIKNKTKLLTYITKAWQFGKSCSLRRTKIIWIGL